MRTFCMTLITLLAITASGHAGIKFKDVAKGRLSNADQQCNLKSTALTHGPLVGAVSAEQARIFVRTPKASGVKIYFKKDETAMSSDRDTDGLPQRTLMKGIVKIV